MAVEMARAQLTKTEAELRLLKAGTWSYDRLVASAAVQQASATVSPNPSARLF